MFIQVAEKLIALEGVSSYTRTIDMRGANAVDVQADLVSSESAPTCSVYVEQGNDRQNWFSVAVAMSFDAVGVKSARVSPISAQYARLRIDLAAGTNAVFSIGVNMAND